MIYYKAELDKFKRKVDDYENNYHYYRMAENYGDFIKYIELPEAEHFMLTDTSTSAWSRVSEEMNVLFKTI